MLQSIESNMLAMVITTIIYNVLKYREETAIFGDLDSVALVFSIGYVVFVQKIPAQRIIV